MIDNPKGIFASLLDISFTSFITTKLVKLMYIISMVLIGLGALAMLIGGFSGGIVSGLLGLIVVPVIAVLEVMTVRVLLELVVVMFRIAEDVNKIAQSK